MATACKHAGADSQIELGYVAEGQVYLHKDLVLHVQFNKEQIDEPRGQISTGTPESFMLS